jgi:diguanylate cyclase (GGDEF)-like protein
MPEDRAMSSVLAELARTLLADVPVQDLLDLALGRIVEVLPVTSAAITLRVSPGLPQLVAATSRESLRLEQLQTDLGQGPCLQAFASGDVVAAADLSADGQFPAFSAVARRLGVNAVFSFPLSHAGGRLGALDLYSEEPGHLSATACARAQTLADVITAYLLNTQSRDRARQDVRWFRHLALHDELTGLANRALLQERLEQAGRRAERSHLTTAVVFADLDGFKAVNDTYGHAVGDELLVAVAHRLAGLVRPGDTLARASGDEFVILCEDLDDDSEVGLLVRRIEEAFEKPFALHDLELKATASLGVAHSGPGRPVDARLVLDADAEMYRAKRRTKDGQVIRLPQQSRTPQH